MTEPAHATPTDPGYDPLEDLLGVLDLTATGLPSPSDSPGEAPTGGLLGAPLDEFVGRSQPQPHGRVFGGQVVAQAIIAAGRTIDDEPGRPRHIHSLHGYFLRAGDARAPLRFVVERLRDGHSFSARRVHAIQGERPILSMIFSFQTADEGVDHQDEMPSVPGPQTLPTVAQLWEALVAHEATESMRPVYDLPDDAAGVWAKRRAIDIRHVEGPVYLPGHGQGSARQNLWIRAAGALPDDPLVHAAVLAYASDYTLLESVLRRHGLGWVDPRLRVASLDHSMWFHRPFRADEWILYAQASPSASGGRGLGTGRMFAPGGSLVASVAQEGMLRLKER